MSHRLGALQRGQDSFDDIVDVTPGTDLTAIVVDGNIVAAQRLGDEAVNRPFTDLVGAVNVERSDREGRQSELFVVVVREMLGGQLADRVRPSSFADRAQAGQVTFTNIVGVAS